MDDSTLSSYVYNFAPEPKHYERVPQILNHLTYIESKKDKNGDTIYYRKRLKAIHKQVYMTIKEIAGEKACFRTEEYIANMCGCSQELVSESKKILSGMFEQIGGNSLLTVEEKRVTTKKEGIKINKRPVHICGINHIWAYNNAYMSEYKEKGRPDLPQLKEIITEKEAELAIEKMNQESIPEIVYNSGGDQKKRSSQKVDQKKRNSSEEEKKGRSEKSGRQKTPLQKPIVFKQDPMARAIQVSLINQENVGDCFHSEHKAREFLELLLIPKNQINDILESYKLEELACNALYLQKKHKNKEINCIPGYFIRSLENKWWMPKAG